MLQMPKRAAAQNVQQPFFYDIMDSLQNATIFRNRMRKMETRTKPWKQGKSIFDYVKSNLDKDGFFIRGTLEDRAVVTGDSDVLLQPGAADAYLASNSQGEEAVGAVGNQIYQVLRAYAEDPTPENATMLYMGISSTPCILYYEQLVDALSEERIPQPLWELAREWMYEASSRETVKLAIVICGLYMLNEQDLSVNWQLKRDLLLLARCEEFTSFVIYALELSHQLEQKDLWDMLQHTSGWGKLCAMQAYDFSAPEDQAWLVIHGCELTIDYPAVSLMVFSRVNIPALLDEPHLEHIQFQGICHILLNYLAFLLGFQQLEAPENGKLPVIDLFSVMKKLLKHAREYHTDLIDGAALINMAGGIRTMVEDECWDYLTMNQCHILISDMEALVFSQDWLPRIKANLLEEDGQVNLLVVQMAYALDLDIHRELWDLLKKDPKRTELYGFLLDTDDKRRFNRVMKFAREHADEYLQEEYVMEPLLQALGEHPGEGEDLLEEALTSIYDSCRNEALSVLDSWPDKNWSPRMRLALVKAREMSQHPLLKLRVDVLLKKRTLDFANFLDVIHEHQK